MDKTILPDKLKQLSFGSPKPSHYPPKLRKARLLLVIKQFSRMFLPIYFPLFVHESSGSSTSSGAFNPTQSLPFASLVCEDEDPVVQFVRIYDQQD
jgi:hypothetical protein